MALSKEYKDLYKKAHDDPVFFVENVVGLTKLWEKQKQITHSVRDNKFTAVRSCNGAGKCVGLNENITLSDGSVVKAYTLIGKHFTLPSYKDGLVSFEKAFGFDNGIKPVYRLTTVTGKVIERTGNHPILSSKLQKYRGIKPEKLDWVQVENLTSEYAVLLPKELNICNPEYTISDDEIKLLAYLLADGGTTHYVSFSQKDNVVKQEFKDIISKSGCTTVDIDSITLKVVGDGSKGGNNVLNLVKEWGLFGTKSIDKTIPDFVWKFSNRQLSLFINRVLSCDGYAYSRNGKRGTNSIGITLASKEFIRQLEILFLRLGFVVSIRYKPVKLNSKIFDSWALEITNQDDILKFKNEINIFGKEENVDKCIKSIDRSKTQKWKTANAPEGFILDRVKCVEYIGEQSTVGISVENTHTFITTVVEHNTFTTANVVAHFLSANPNSVVITTAPTSRQVRELLWQEIRNIHANSRYPLGGTTTTVSWTLGAKWFALGLSTDEPNRFQGFHAEHILGIIDEAAGVEAPIWEGMDAILTSSDAHLLVIGNPTEPSGRFYDAFASPLYNKIHISAFDTPNFTNSGITFNDIKSGEWKTKFKGLVYPALITPEWVSERLSEWGEESPAFQSRVLGNFPLIGSDTMIPLSWVLRATEREVSHKTLDAPVLAIDVARFGDDDSVIVCRRGDNLCRKEVFHGLDVNPLSKIAKNIADSEGNFKSDTGDGVIIVDAVGIGAGVASNLRAWGYRAIDFVSQGRAWEQDKFVNRRTEAWFRVRERFRKNEINITHDESLVGQLTAPRYDFDGAGRYRLESKEHMKSRGVSSPDEADAVIMAFDFDGNLDTTTISDYNEGQTHTVKAGTVEDLLRMVSKGREEDFEWDMTRF